MDTKLLSVKYKTELPEIGMMSKHHAWKRRHCEYGVLLILLHPIRYEKGEVGIVKCHKKTVFQKTIADYLYVIELNFVISCI